MMKTGKNNRFLASILAASMMLTMSPFAFAAEQKEMTTQEQIQSTTQNETNANPAVSQTEDQSPKDTNSEALKTEGQSSEGTNSEASKTEGQPPKDTNSKDGQPSENVKPADKDTNAGGSTSTSENAAKIGDTEYASIADAMAAAKPGDTIELLKDITESVEVKVSSKDFGGKGELTINLNKYSIDGDSHRCIWRTGNQDCWPKKLIVKNGTLKNAGSNRVIQWQGDLEVIDCRFENNQGGAIQSVSGNTTIADSTFGENQSGDAAGAAIQLIGNTECTITGSNFSKNVTSNLGGAVYVDHGTIDITDCTFEKNSAGYGGAIAVNEVEKLTIGNNTNCLGNEATSGGGAIYANIAASINIAENSVLCNNTATSWGGGIYASASNINIAANSAVYNNTATTAGDDLFFFNNSTFTLPNAKEMSGDRILSSDKLEITGWYHDGWKKWNAAQGGSETIGRWVDGYIDEYTPVKKDTPYITLKAAHPRMYTLTYEVTGDLPPEGYTVPAKQTLVDGSKYTVADVPASVSGSKDGVNGTFSFNGWKTKDGTVLTGEQTLTADLTLYGVWTFTKKSSGGGGGHKPTVTIPDDVPTGLNGDDHYAYIVGYPDSTVRPQNGITRAEVATIFFRLLTDETRNANSTKSNSYSDVAAGAWYNHAVSTLSAMGIVKGDSHGKFNPNAPITRAEFAAIAARFDDKANTTAVDFSDIASHWAKDEISAAANNGWINGYTDGTFRPNNKITRAEAMTLVNRVLKRLPETAEDLHNDMIKWSDNSDTSAWYYLAVQEATNSHYYKTKENKFEKWSKLRETRDWTELEK